MPSLFLSRDLDSSSALATWAVQHSLEVMAKSLLAFHPFPFVAPKAADWWFFYSSRAVQFSVDALRQLQEKPKLATMGSGTATTLLAEGFTTDFCGRGQPDQVAREFGKLCQQQRVFFPRARQSRLTIQRLLAQEILLEDAICYDNRPVPAKTSIKADYFCFTSPLNVAAYLDHQALPAGAKVVAIGPSTAAALAERTVRHSVLPEPSEEALINWLAVELGAS